MPIKLIIFDLDGTLVDSGADITNAINYAVEPYGIAPVTVRKIISMVGEGITKLMERLIQEAGLSAGAASPDAGLKDILTERFVEYYSAHPVDNTKAYPGVASTLEALSSYKKAVISNKREVLSRKILEALDLASHFDIIAGSDTTPERKPSPVPIFHVLSKLGLQAGDAVIVGDSNFDVEAGKAAGIRTVAVTYGYRPVEVLRDADFIIDRMQDLPGIIQGISS